jgi:hypothetical protein
MNLSVKSSHWSFIILNNKTTMPNVCSVELKTNKEPRKIGKGICSIKHTGTHYGIRILRGLIYLIDFVIHFICRAKACEGPPRNL